MNTLPNQTASESALALAADEHDTQTPANTCCACAKCATQLDRLVAAIDRQTAVHERIVLAIDDRPGSLSPIIDMVGAAINANLANIAWAIQETGKNTVAARPGRKPKTGGLR